MEAALRWLADHTPATAELLRLRDATPIPCGQSVITAGRSSLFGYAGRNDRYRSVWLRDAPHRDPQTVLEHDRILAACTEHSLPEARNGIARNQARIAITVMTHAVPEREPATIRAALQLVPGT
jgi:hypothetical protein